MHHDRHYADQSIAPEIARLREIAGGLRNYRSIGTSPLGWAIGIETVCERLEEKRPERQTGGFSPSDGFIDGAGYPVI